MKRLVPAIFAAILLVSACDTFKVGVFEDEMILPLEGSREDSLFYKVSIQYASGGTLIPAMERINNTIVAQAFDLEDSDAATLEETAVQYRENLIDEYITENSGMIGKMPVLSWEDNIIGEFTGKYKGWRNYQINYYFYRGGAHGSSTCSQIVFDAKTGETLTEDTLFAEGYFENVAALMQAQAKADIEAENPDVLDLLELDLVVPNGNFSVGQSGVMWLFQPDDLLPHAFGPLCVTVSWDKLKPYLR